MRRVVVTGVGVVSPLGTGLARYHDGLRTGRAGIDAISSFDARSFPSRIAGEIRDLQLDAVPLPHGKKAAMLRDPKSIYGVVAAREAQESAFGQQKPFAAYPVERRAAFIATGLEIFNCEDIARFMKERVIDGGRLFESLQAYPVHSFLQIPADLGARLIVREAQIGGLVSVNVSACAAGTQSLGEAFRAIREGAADAAIAGGYDSMVNPIAVGGFSLLDALSTANELGGGASRPFDRHRDGFVLGEGAGFLILEARERAVKRGAPIRAEILGYGASLDAYRVTDPAPDQSGATAAMKQALRDGRLAASDVDYINAHGTATRKNDPAETAAIRWVFGRRADEIPVSSTKSQIGHLIGAAGSVEFIAGLFALEEQLAPATINLEEPDPACDLDYVPRQPQPANIRVFMSNSFGFGGQNASIIAGVDDGN